ncbi:metallophosphoesterase [bacterium]|nr:metallophosphoesterase [bacterium]
MKDSQSKRTVIIGDVHGCLEELDLLLAKVNYRPEKDSLYFLGDIINRGPYSKETYHRYKELQAVSILGNHEWHILTDMKNHGISKYCQRLRAEFGVAFDDFLNDIEQWPLFIENDEFILVHGGLAPGKSPKVTDPKILTAIRTWDGKGDILDHPKNTPWFELYTDSKLVVFGHWAALEGVVRQNSIGLDTGCVYGKKLTALILPERTLVSVQAKKTYHPINSDWVLKKR